MTTSGVPKIVNHRAASINVGDKMMGFGNKK